MAGLIYSNDLRAVGCSTAVHEAFKFEIERKTACMRKLMLKKIYLSKYVCEKSSKVTDLIHNELSDFEKRVLNETLYKGKRLDNFFNKHWAKL